MKTLVICDDYWHPARTPRAGLAPLAEQGFAFDWIESAAGITGTALAAQMAAYPLVILTKSNNISAADQTPWMTPEMEAAFADYVRNGGGLLVIHSGSAGYAETPVLRALIGGVFTHHPPQCMVTVQPRSGLSPLAHVAPFTLKDEHYFMALDDDKAEVFLDSVSEHGTQPAGWTRTEGDGRVCMLTPGHNLEVWLAPTYQTAIQNAARWCANAG